LGPGGRGRVARRAGGRRPARAGGGGRTVNAVLRGIRVIDPLAGRDQVDMDVWLRGGRIEAIERRIRTDQAPTLDLARAPGLPEVVLCPGFIDLHTHLRQPGGEGAEAVRRRG